MKFAFIRDHRREFPVEALCDVLGVSRGGFYAWDRRPASARDLRRAELAAKVRETHAESRSPSTAPRACIAPSSRRAWPAARTRWPG